MKKFIPVLLFSALLVCCTMTESLNIGDNGSVGVSDIAVEDFFMLVLDDYSEFFPDSGDIVGKSLSDFASSCGGAYEKTGNNHYRLTLPFESASSFISSFSGESQTIISDSSSYFSLRLDIDNYGDLKKAVPLLSDPNFEVYAAEYNIGMSAEDYLDMISFLLGEEGPDAITSSLITVNITVPGEVAETFNCVQTGRDSISFSFTLLDFLLLSSPIEFSVSWK